MSELLLMIDRFRRSVLLNRNARSHLKQRWGVLDPPRRLQPHEARGTRRFRRNQPLACRPMPRFCAAVLIAFLLASTPAPRRPCPSPRTA